MKSICPKCGGHWVFGPYYIVRYGHELLEYRCGCGYRWTEATRDTPRREARKPCSLRKRIIGDAAPAAKEAVSADEPIARKAQ